LEAVMEMIPGSILTKDQQHFLYKAHYNSVYHTVYYTLKDRSLAEDLTNDAYLLAFEKIHTLRDKEKFRNWICTIAANLAKDYIKKNRRLHIVNTIEELPGKADAVEDVVLQKLDKSEIKEAISGLDHNYKNVILLRYYHDLSYKDIARQLNLNDNTVKTRLKRAKGKLYHLLS